MPSSYPSSIDAFPDPLANSPLNAPSHSALHQDVNDAVEKIETKVGLGSSPASASSAGQVLRASGSGNTAWARIGATDIDATGRAANDVIVADGAGNAAWSAAAGLWLISTTTIGTGVSSVTVNNAFSSAYQSYRIFIENNDTNGGASHTFQFSGITTNTYLTGGSYGSWAGATQIGYGPSAGNIWILSANAAANTGTLITLDVTNPNIARRKYGFNTAQAGNGHATFNQYSTSTSTATGFVLAKAGDTMTGGTIRVYGYRN